jgi:hypothetical protein
MENKFIFFLLPAALVSLATGGLLFVFFILSQVGRYIAAEALRFLFPIIDPWVKNDYEVFAYSPQQLMVLVVPIAIIVGIAFFTIRFARTASRITSLEYKLSKDRVEIAQQDLYIAGIAKKNADAQATDIVEDVVKPEASKALFFDGLIRTSNENLNRYYDQTRGQAGNSFILSVVICAFGWIVIIVGIVLLLAGKTSPAYVTTAAGVLSEFISAVFLYFYNSTVKSMSKYHTKLVLSQNISIALRVAEELPDEIKGQVSADLIKQLVQDINMHIVKEEK